jgi:aryl-alcohol dehydrogenase-like predicted oxidoreductase
MGTGGPNVLGQRLGRTETEMRALLRRAYDLGINLFDTAREYMESEVILGNVLKDLPRDRVVVSTKFGAVMADDSGVKIKTADEVVESVESSLRRMQLSEIDVVMVAGLLTPENAASVLEEQVPALERLRDQGKIRHVGSSEASSSDGSHDWFRLVLPEDVFDVAMVGHNMLNQSARHHVFPACADGNIGVMNIYTSRRVFSDPERLREVVIELADRGSISGAAATDDQPLSWLLQSGEVDSLVEAAYRYAAYTPGVTAVMTGTIDTDHLEQNVKSVVNGSLSVETLARLERDYGTVSEPIGN